MNWGNLTRVLLDSPWREASDDLSISHIDVKERFLPNPSKIRLSSSLIMPPWKRVRAIRPVLALERYLAQSESFCLTRASGISPRGENLAPARGWGWRGI
jgi:hypothetical protein